MRIATWNVNSLRVRLPPQLTQWLQNDPLDVLALQETKVEDAGFPHAEIEALGYRARASGQRSYNGVAILSRLPVADVVTDIPGFDDDHRRVLAGTVEGVRIIDIYVPNGHALDSPKFQCKLRWLAALRDYLRTELQRHEHLGRVLPAQPRVTHRPRPDEHRTRGEM